MVGKDIAKALILSTSKVVPPRIEKAKTVKLYKVCVCVCACVCVYANEKERNSMTSDNKINNLVTSTCETHSYKCHISHNLRGKPFS